MLSAILALTDFAWRRIPNRVLIPGGAALTLLLSAATIAHGEPFRLLTAIALAATVFALYFALAWLAPGSLGAGDVKLAAFVGLILGYFSWEGSLLGTFASAAVMWGVIGAWVIGGVAAALALVTQRLIRIRRHKRKTSQISALRLPFAPCMLIASWVALAVHT